PDGSRVAYGGRWLTVAQIDGSHPRETFETPHTIILTPMWPPIGDRIPFTSITEPTPFGRPHDFSGRSIDVGVVDVATGRVTMPAQAEGNDYVVATDFSRDGSRILLQGGLFNRHRTSLWSVNVDGSDLRQLVTGTARGDWTS